MHLHDARVLQPRHHAGLVREARKSIGDSVNAGEVVAVLETNLTLATIEVRGHAPVRLDAPDGRVSFFPRAWATVQTTDGRHGVGWLEWNRNQPTAG